MVVFIILILMTLCPLFVIAADQNERLLIPYQKPPRAIIDIAEAPFTPGASVDPRGQFMLLLDRPSMPVIKDIALPEIGLGGLRINPATNGKSRGYYWSNLSILEIKNGQKHQVSSLPTSPRLSNVRWAPNGEYIAFAQTTEHAVELWIVKMSSCQAQKVNSIHLNNLHDDPFYWTSRSDKLVCLTVSKSKGPKPQARSFPSGPIIRENSGKIAPARTYQNLLQNFFDEQLFEYYLNTQIVLVSLTGLQEPLGKSDLIVRAEPSPNGRYILVERLRRPFSYSVPYYRFPLHIDIVDFSGNFVYRFAELPLAENIPIQFGSCRTGPREIQWRADHDATIFWVEAEDNGDPRKKAQVRDQLYLLSEPFSGKPIPLMSLDLRFGDVYWSSGSLAIVDEWWWDTRRLRTWVVQPDHHDSKPRLMFDYSWEDQYNNPGDPILQRSQRGTLTLATTKRNSEIFYSGKGASPEGDRPFLDQISIKNFKKKRLFRSESPHYERVKAIIDTQKKIIITRREAQNEPPNYYYRNLRKNKTIALTDFPHPYPHLATISKSIIQYQRSDGVQLSGTLYLPADYSIDKGPLPLIMWAYPKNYKSAAAASQVRDSPHRFIWLPRWSPLVWLTQGYAVLDDPAMPIVGSDQQKPNDTFLEQLIANARAAVQKVDDMGIAHPDRIVIGGHSYGAFMAVNLLAHSDLFRAGIAQSGAYNRTLTPFGFQNEQRTLWEASNVYVQMSPFMHAHKINEPLLLIHGEKDNNTGTYPLQSKRLYQALKGHGATVRLVLLPHESHSYKASESILHVLWETQQWLESHVKPK